MLELIDAPGLTPALTAAIADPDQPTPRLVLDLDVVARQYDEFVAALPGVEVFYAVKANPLPEVLRTLAERGSCFDIASIGELELCRSLGIDPGRLSYGNTVKRSADIALAASLGVEMFAFDSAEELSKLVTSAPGAVAFCRLTTDSIGSDWPLSKKFGTTPERATELLVRAANNGMRIGVSFHVGSQQRDLGGWVRALGKVRLVVERLAELGLDLDVLNLGGDSRPTISSRSRRSRRSVTSSPTSSATCVPGSVG
ncbi:MAG: hypothetical protein R2715_15155 [Ilumatobacteraceae bacterium]